MRSFLQAQSTKVAQLDDARVAGVQRLEAFQRVVEGHEIDAVHLSQVPRLRQRDVHLAVTPFCAPTRPCFIDQDPAHDLRRHSEKMGAVLPLDILPVHQPQIGLVDERGGLEDVAGSLSRHLARGQVMQFLVDQRRQGLEGGPITIAPRDEQLRHVPWSTHQRLREA